MIERSPIVAYADEPLRMIVFRMAETGLTRLPVIADDRTLVGMIALTDLLTARTRILERRATARAGARRPAGLPIVFGGRSDIVS